MDVIIPAAHKDFNKLPFLTRSIRRFLNPQPDRIIVIYDNDQRFPYRLVEDDVLYIPEQDVLPFDKRAAGHFRRPAWIYQQFLKLFSFISDEYLIVDADLIFNRTFHVYDEFRRPKFFLGIDQHHRPYFEYSNYFFGIGRAFNHSFISEVMLFRTEICTQILKTFWDRFFEEDFEQERAIRELYDMTAVMAHENFIPADYEIYGNFVHHHPHLRDLYTKVFMKTKLEGQYREWGETEIDRLVQIMKDQDYDVFTLHTWI